MNDLRVWRGKDFCFAAIPNDRWVLVYVRKPEIRRGQLTHQSVSEIFPDIRLTNAGELTLRVREAITASRWIDMIRATILQDLPLRTQSRT